MECGGKRSATPLWMSDKLQFVVEVEKGLVAEPRDKLKGVETNWWNVGIGIYCWERGRLVRIERGARTSGSEGTLMFKQRTKRALLAVRTRRPRSQR